MINDYFVLSKRGWIINCNTFNVDQLNCQFRRLYFGFIFTRCTRSDLGVCMNAVKAKLVFQMDFRQLYRLEGIT